MSYYNSVTGIVSPKPKRIAVNDANVSSKWGDFSDAELAQHGYYPYVRATYDKNTQRLGDIQVVNGTATEEVIALTTEEQATLQRETKLKQIRSTFELLARCSIAVFEKLKTDGVISAQDFPVDIRQSYVELKTLIDEVFPQ